MAPNPRNPIGKSSTKNFPTSPKNRAASPTNGSPSNRLRKKELVETISSQDELAAIIECEHRLVVLDVYSAWCGPCKQMHPTFKTLQTNINEFEDRVALYEVELTIIRSLMPDLNFKESSQPRFLFYLKGKLEHVIEEINAPEILRTIDEFMPDPFDMYDE